MREPLYKRKSLIYTVDSRDFGLFCIGRCEKMENKRVRPVLCYTQGSSEAVFSLVVLTFVPKDPAVLLAARRSSALEMT